LKLSPISWDDHANRRISPTVGGEHQCTHLQRSAGPGSGVPMIAACARSRAPLGDITRLRQECRAGPSAMMIRITRPVWIPFKDAASVADVECRIDYNSFQQVALSELRTLQGLDPATVIGADLTLHSLFSAATTTVSCLMSVAQSGTRTFMRRVPSDAVRVCSMTS